MNAGAISVDASGLQAASTAGPTGSNAQHENMPPFLAVSYIIACDGIYPPRP